MNIKAATIGRTFVLSFGFLGGALAGVWLGLVVAFVSGMAPSYPARFRGEDLAAALVAALCLATLHSLIRRTDGRASSLGLLFVTAFAALDLLCSLYLLTPPKVLCVVPPQYIEASTASGVLFAGSQETPPEFRPAAPLLYSLRFAAAMIPAALVAVLLCSATVWRSALLQLVGFVVGSLCALAGLLLSLARAFT